MPRLVVQGTGMCMRGFIKLARHCAVTQGVTLLYFRLKPVLQEIRRGQETTTEALNSVFQPCSQSFS